MVNGFILIGLSLNLLGVILISFSFRIQVEKKILMSGSPAIKLKYYNRFLLKIGWFSLISGYLFQIGGCFI